MKKHYALLLPMVLFTCILFAQQRILSEGTIHYAIQIESGSTASKSKPTGVDQAQGLVYLKGSQSRTDLSSVLGHETIFHDARSGEATILKEYSGQKLMIKLTRDDWGHRNRKYDRLAYTELNDSRQVAGYDCKGAKARLADGTTILAYYATGLNTLNKEYDPAFRSLPGLPLYYEVQSAKMKVVYTATLVDQSPVSLSRFELPEAGYRAMPYQETIRAKE